MVGHLKPRALGRVKIVLKISMMEIIQHLSRLEVQAFLGSKWP